MELRDALVQIEEIRLHLARTESFRGFRAAPVAISGVLAITAAVLQSMLIPDPTHAATAYVMLWTGAALLSGLAAGVEMLWRMTRMDIGLLRETNFLAIEQFLPCLAAGGITTAVILAFLPEHLSLLPGLWSLFFSMGIFACWRLLPKAIFGVGIYYLLSGAAVLALAGDQSALSPWTMVATFGVGQLLAALVLYLQMERDQ